MTQPETKMGTCARILCAIFMVIYLAVLGYACYVIDINRKMENWKVAAIAGAIWWFVATVYSGMLWAFFHFDCCCSCSCLSSTDLHKLEKFFEIMFWCTNFIFFILICFTCPQCLDSCSSSSSNQVSPSHELTQIHTSTSSPQEAWSPTIGEIGYLGKAVTDGAKSIESAKQLHDMRKTAYNV